MYKKYFLTFILLISLQQVHAQLLSQKIDSLGQITLERTKTIGGYLSIIKNDSIIYSSGFGYNDLQTKSQLTDSTIFPISSNTKAFNSILLSQFVEEGKLDFNKPLKAYLPDLEFKNDFITSEVNLTDLLTHRFGFPRYDFTHYMLSEEEKKDPNKSVFKKLKYLEPTSSFRTQFQYGNNQYILAAYLLERLSGKKWEELLEEKILSPLMMRDTHWDLEKYKSANNRSLGYQNGNLIDIDYAAPIYSVSGMGNLFSTIHDLEKWCRFLINGNDSILSKELIDYNLKGHFAIGFEEPYPGFSALEYGLGWFVFDYYGHKVVMHHGDNMGHQSLIVLLPDDNLSWILLANEGFSAQSFPFRMTFSLLDLFVGKDLNDWNQLLARNPKIFLRHPDSLKVQNNNPTLKIRDYKGLYRHEGFGTIEISMIKNKLKVQAGNYTEEITYYGNDSFRAFSKEFKEDYIFKFNLNEENEIISLETDLIEPSVGLIEFKKVL
ncbi:serine hydrolase [Xanthovirga aplysinae]|uniref:serine hydrolase n=1 Tax=Xanthovirga aplysinae TaxID=2529853 RepID=UPI0012BC8C16|nr:serine hydrolase [Xanthovirga aplysinae]MTI33393.1 serine hydrolase [Xanthovirga aplysinae]